MPQTPEDLSKIIREIAVRHAKIRGRGIKNDALEQISRIPIEYAEQQTISVNLAELDRMVGDVIELAAQFTKDNIGQLEIDMALRKVTCHYLWFC